MTTVKDSFDDAKRNSTKVSDLSRQLAFAGIAVVWIFKKDVGGVPVVADTLVRATFIFASGLALDISQYLWLTVATWMKAKRRESELKLELIPFDERGGKPVRNPAWIPNVAWTFWALKVAFIIFGWWTLLDYLMGVLLYS